MCVCVWLCVCVCVPHLNGLYHRNYWTDFDHFWHTDWKYGPTDCIIVSKWWRHQWPLEALFSESSCTKEHTHTNTHTHTHTNTQTYPHKHTHTHQHTHTNTQTHPHKHTHKHRPLDLSTLGFIDPRIYRPWDLSTLGSIGPRIYRPWDLLTWPSDLSALGSINPRIYRPWDLSSWPHSVAMSLHYGRKKHVNARYNTRGKLTVKWRMIEIALPWRPVPKQIGILLTYVWLIIMVRNCYVYFSLHYAWRWIQISEKLLK